MRMKKILININNLDEIKEYKEIGITNFLFAVKDLAVGYKTFALSEIPKESYILLNRVMDASAIELVRSLKEELLTFKGIIFEDLGIYNMFKDEDTELIWFQNHFGTNTSSINYYLDHGCESAFISNEITKEEIIDIVNNVHKPVILTVLGRNQIMYSRRTLLSNFNKYNNLDDYNDMTLDVMHNECTFKAHEDKFGTVVYNNEYFNYVPMMNEVNNDNIKYFYVYNLDLKPSEVKEILEGKPFGDTGFLNKKTVYKMSEYTDR